MNQFNIQMLPPFQVGLIARILAKPVNYGLELHNVPASWRESKGEGIRVGVIDTGRPDHRDLAQSVVSWKNFTNDSMMDKVQGHGTHVCGIIGGRPAREGEGITGIAPGCELIVAKALGDDGSGSDRSIASAIEWCAESGCKVINMSLGAPAHYERHFPATKSAVARAAKMGVIMVCAAGNDGADTVDLPGLFEQTITVGAVNSARERAWFSNKGRHLDFAAAGERIMSTFKNNTYAELSGTSMAAPQIAGIAALILSSHLKSPGSTPVDDHDSMVEHLQRMSVDFGEQGFDVEYGWGIPIFGHINPEYPDDPIADEKPKRGFSLLDAFLWLIRKR